MTITKFVWQKARRISKLPGTYSLFYAVSNMIYRDGNAVTVQLGPAAGYRWRHYHCYQPWMALGLYEPEVAQLIYHSLKPGDVFYDIGANAGYFTLIAAKAVGSTGKVIAFDPVPKNVETVNEQIKLNKLQDRASIEPLAISNFNGPVELLIPSRNANAHLADVEAPHVANSGGTIVDVTCVSLDHYISQHIRPTLIKMDIEGAEVKALKGATQLLAGLNPPIFLITAHSTALARQVKDILIQSGYKFTSFPHMIHAIPQSVADQYDNQKYKIIGAG